MVNALDVFKIIMIIQMFYAFSITSIAYALPEDSLNYVDIYTNVGEQFSLETISEEVDATLKSQQTLPIIELGALLYYSGNILIDFMLNFIFAVPQMINLIINGIMMLFSINSFISAQITLFAYVIITTMYTIAIIQLLTAIRSGRQVA